MKRAILFLLLIPVSGLAQDYQTVRSDFVHFFLDENGSDHGMRMDSSHVDGVDSVLTNYLTLRYPDHDVIDAYVPSWLGAKTVIRPNGENLFFNVDADTIRIETLAQLNDQWNLFSLDAASYLEATVIDVSPSVILDSTVEVKTILLQRMDLLGNPLAHALNGKTIKISNSLGIVQALDFHLFPDDTVQIEIAGMENPNAGVHRLTRGEIYDFEVGDEFHFESKEVTWYNSPPILRKEIYRVLGFSTVSGIHTIEFEVYWWKRVVNESGFPTYYTITTGYYPSSSEHVPNLNSIVAQAMPNEASLMFDTLGGYAETNIVNYGLHSSGRESVTFQGDMNIAWELNGQLLWEPQQTISGWYYQISSSAKGIGRTYWSNQQWDGHTEWDDFERWLVYFKKGSEEWGEPWTVSEILGIQQTQVSDRSIYPNPVKHGSPVNLGSIFSQIDVLDMTGKAVVSKQQSATLETNELKAGVYLVRLQIEDNVSMQKLAVTE